MAIQDQGFGGSQDGRPHGGGAPDQYRVRTIVSPSSGARQITTIIVNALEQANPTKKADGQFALFVLLGKGDPTWYDTLASDPNSASMTVLVYNLINSTDAAQRFEFLPGELQARDGEFLHVAIGAILDQTSGLPVNTVGQVTVLGLSNDQPLNLKLR